MEDIDWIHSCKQGNRKAQEWLFKTYSNRMQALFLRYVRTSAEAEAEDVMMEGFIKIFKNIHKYEFTGSFHAWLKRIMVHTAINHYHSNQKFKQNIDIEISKNGKSIISTKKECQRVFASGNCEISYYNHINTKILWQVGIGFSNTKRSIYNSNAPIKEMPKTFSIDMGLM